MAKIKLQGNASGTGVITVTAPNTSTDRTITLPDADVTLGAATPSITDGGNATAITIDSSENVGIGESTMQANLHVKKGDSAALVHASAALYIENSGDAILQIGSPAANEGRILFSDPADANIGQICYGHSDNHMRFRTNDSEQLRLTADGRGLSQFTAKAWAKINMNGGHVIDDSHNISSISDGGTGICTFNIDVDPATAHYSVVTSGYNSSVINASIGSISTGSFLVNSKHYHNDTFYDRGLCAVVFGD
jgi:hypothetical protein